MVKRGTFREDLYYRVNVFPIRVPPLRERERDIDELARVFLERNARQLGRELAPLSEAALERLRGYAWPGNVCELQNVIERGVIVSSEGIFDIEHSGQSGWQKRSRRAARHPPVHPQLAHEEPRHRASSALSLACPAHEGVHRE